MNNHRLGLTGLLLALGLSAAPAYAGSTRTWVSGMGADSGACGLSAPCRSFAYAITQTTPGGEIDVLDPAGYGALTITQAVSIVNDGVGEAGVQASAGATAITINANAADTITLRGLTIDGVGAGANGIRFNTGGSLTVAKCVVRNFANASIEIEPTASMTFSISNTLVSDNSVVGIDVLPQGSGSASGIIDHVVADNSNYGILVDTISTTASAPASDVTVVDSAAANNIQVGIQSFMSSGTAAVSVVVRNSVASNNGAGFKAQNGANLFLGHSAATANNIGVSIGASTTVYSFGDNDIDGNGVDVSGGSLTAAATH